MDTFSHALWAILPFKYMNLKKKRFNLWAAAFWGMFPDIFAFAVPFLWMAFSVTIGGMAVSQFPNAVSFEPVDPALAPVFSLVHVLYSLSHSLIIFALITGISYLLFKDKTVYLGGWLIHILIDIPTHSYDFYPTPIFWPLSDWKLNGIKWANGWVLIANFALLAVFYFWLWRKEKRMRKAKGRKRKSR